MSLIEQLQAITEANKKPDFNTYAWVERISIQFVEASFAHAQKGESSFSVTMIENCWIAPKGVFVRPNKEQWEEICAAVVRELKNRGLSSHKTVSAESPEFPEIHVSWERKA
jgi:hypothetical protein